MKLALTRPSSLMNFGTAYWLGPQCGVNKYCVFCTVKIKKANKNLQHRTLSGFITIAPYYQCSKRVTTPLKKGGDTLIKRELRGDIFKLFDSRLFTRQNFLALADHGYVYGDDLAIKTF